MSNMMKLVLGLAVVGLLLGLVTVIIASLALEDASDPWSTIPEPCLVPLQSNHSVLVSQDTVCEMPLAHFLHGLAGPGLTVTASKSALAVDMAAFPQPEVAHGCWRSEAALQHTVGAIESFVLLRALAAVAPPVLFTLEAAGARYDGPRRALFHVTLMVSSRSGIPCSFSVCEDERPLLTATQGVLDTVAPVSLTTLAWLESGQHLRICVQAEQDGQITFAHIGLTVIGVV